MQNTNLRKPVKFILWAVTMVTAILLIRNCQTSQPSTSKGQEYYSITGGVHGTYYTIKYATEADTIDAEELQACFEAFDQSLSTFKETSVISRINRNAPDVVPDSFFITVFNKGMEISRLTDGAFDMTVAPLVNLWGFGFKKSENVTDEHVKEILQHVGYEKVKLENGRIVKTDTALMLDAAAIAKGYSCDVIAQFLQSKGYENYMVEIGGEVVTHGVNPKGELWRIGISKPTDDNNVDNPELQASVSIGDIGTATSGNYRQFYYKDGKRFSHTVNPHTGYPVEHNLLSATVFAENCMTADALATAFMVMGLEKAKEYVEKQESKVTAYFIYADDENNIRTLTVGPDKDKFDIQELQ